MHTTGTAVASQPTAQPTHAVQTPARHTRHTNKYCTNVVCRAALKYKHLCPEHARDFCVWIQQQSCNDLLETIQKGIRVQCV